VHKYSCTATIHLDSSPLALEASSSRLVMAPPCFPDRTLTLNLRHCHCDGIAKLDLWCERRIYQGVLSLITPLDPLYIGEAESPHLGWVNRPWHQRLYTAPVGNLESLRLASKTLIGSSALAHSFPQDFRNATLTYAEQRVRPLQIDRVPCAKKDIGNYCKFSMCRC
jgi:hypothetical protein